MKKITLLIILGILYVNTGILAQNICIGTAAPQARLHVADSSVVFTASGDIESPAGFPPVETVGRRMMWYPSKAAFRVGYTSNANSNLWTKDNIGYYSFAAGQSTNASGLAAFAVGSGCRASGNYSVAMGTSTASGNQSTASGNSTASAVGSVAMGAATASAPHAIAFGFVANANADNAIALGHLVTASGISSVAMGHLVTANGNSSTAMGNYVTTSGFEGAFTIGDNSTTTVMQTFVANGFRARFAGGYRLFTNSDANIGSFLNAGANSWAALSDVRLKENFEKVDGESFLRKIATMPLTTWNYKTQAPETFRHYGPMAQDFFEAFGKDSYGTIGCDTLINQQDFLGVNLIAIQALEKRTGTQHKKLEDLQKENQQLKQELDEIKTMLKIILSDQTAVETVAEKK